MTMHDRFLNATLYNKFLPTCFGVNRFKQIITPSSQQIPKTMSSKSCPPTLKHLNYNFIHHKFFIQQFDNENCVKFILHKFVTYGFVVPKHVHHHTTFNSFLMNFLLPRLFTSSHTQAKG
jgi:hypothetical protein